MRIIKGKTTWIDILQPNEADIEALKKYHKFHPIILDELLHSSARSQAERYDDYLFIIYHLPVYDPATKTSRRAEVDFLITKNLIITVSYEKLEQTDAFLQELMKDEKLRAKTLKGDTLLPFYSILNQTLAFARRQLRHIEEEVSFITKEMFDRQDELLKTITYTKRNIVDYRMIVRPQGVMMESLIKIGMEFWGAQSKVYLADLAGDHLRVLQELENNFTTIEALESTNTQLLNAETNATIKRFTILAFLISLPVAYIFLAEVRYVADELGSGANFWLGFFLVIAFTGIIGYLFRRKKLL